MHFLINANILMNITQWGGSCCLAHIIRVEAKGQSLQFDKDVQVCHIGQVIIIILLTDPYLVFSFFIRFWRFDEQSFIFFHFQKTIFRIILIIFLFFYRGLDHLYLTISKFAKIQLYFYQFFPIFLKHYYRQLSKKTMGACMIGYSKEISQECPQQNRTLSTEEKAKIEDELKVKPEEIETLKQSSEAESASKVVTEQARQYLRYATRTSRKSRFFREKKEEEGVFSLIDHTETTRQPSSGLQLRRSCRKTSKRPRKNKFRDQDWEDETSAQRRSSSQNIFQTFAQQNNLQSFISVRQKKPLLLPLEAVEEVNQTTLVGVVSEKDEIENSLQLDENNLQIKYADGCRYWGEVANAKRHGKGVLEWGDGSKYEGDWNEGNAEGFGVLTYADGDLYSGEFRKNQAEGTGKFISTEGATYEGEWRQSLPDGQGSEVFLNSEKYTGSWSKGKKNGFGELYFQDGVSFYRGEFCNNELHGRGEYYWHGKSRYTGQWQHNERSGAGSMEWENGQRYEGEFQRDKMHGRGVFLARDGSAFRGEWECGRREGVIVETLPTGQVRHGVWYFNKLLHYMKAAEVGEEVRQAPRGRRTCKV